MQNLENYKKEFDSQIKQTFSGEAKKLLTWGLHENDQSMAKLIQEAMKLGGKRFRAYLVESWYETIKPVDENSRELAIIMEAIHGATLHIDDVQDRSALRRGEPSFHSVHGEPLAINTGLLILYGAEHAAHHLPHSEKLTRAINNKLTQLLLGQGSDVHWEQTKAFEQHFHEYERMAARKTGALFALCVESATIIAGQQINAEILKICEDIGVLYQIVDDVLNIKENSKLGKEFAEDIKEKKITAVFLYAIDNCSKEDKEKLMSIYHQEKIEQKDIEKVLQIFNKVNTTEQLVEYCKTLAKQIETKIDQSTASEKQKALLLSILHTYSRLE